MPFTQNALAPAVEAAPGCATHGAASVELVDSVDWVRAIEVAAEGESAKAAKEEAAEALSRSHRVRHRQQRE